MAATVDWGAPFLRCGLQMLCGLQNMQALGWHPQRPGTSPAPAPTPLLPGTALEEPALTALSLSDCSGPLAVDGLPPVVPARWAALSKLQRLSLGGTDCNDGTWGGTTLAALLDQAPELEALSLSSCKLTQVPPVLAAAPRPGLTELSLSFNELTDLPPGDWLTGELTCWARLGNGPGQRTLVWGLGGDLGDHTS